MQCVSCHFENMPGTQFCGRCGTSIVLADIDVNPPRATRFSKAWRRVSWPANRLRIEARRVRIEATEGFGARVRRAVPSADLLRRLLIPGWPQFYNGNFAIGRVLLLSYVILVALGMLLYGTAWGSIVLGTAFGVHVWSVLQAIGPADAGMLLKMRRGAGVALALLTLVYVPAIWVLSYAFDARVATADLGAIASGDVLLIHHLRAARVGDVVVYSLDYQQVYAANHVVAYIGGPQMERIVAAAGDRVEVRNRVFLVNGRPSSVQPMDYRNIPESLTVTVPEKSFLVFPSLAIMPNYAAQVRAAAGTKPYIVPADKVVGIAYWRHQPLSRWGPLP